MCDYTDVFTCSCRLTQGCTVKAASQTALYQLNPPLHPVSGNLLVCGSHTQMRAAPSRPSSTRAAHGRPSPVRSSPFPVRAARSSPTSAKAAHSSPRQGSTLLTATSSACIAAHLSMAVVSSQGSIVEFRYCLLGSLGNIRGWTTTLTFRLQEAAAGTMTWTASTPMLASQLSTSVLVLSMHSSPHRLVMKVQAVVGQPSMHSMHSIWPGQALGSQAVAPQLSMHSILL